MMLLRCWLARMGSNPPEAYSWSAIVRRPPSTSLTMNRMTARDQPEPGEPGESAACAQAERRLRADAARNRDAIVAVARDVFAEQGLEAPLEAIAARAGVGIATLYRRFPSREKLVAAALVDKVNQYAQAAEQALEVPDPW